MKIEKLEVGIYAANCYIVFDELKKAFIIDPGGSFNKIKEFILENDLKVEKILLTHAHADHIGALKKLKDFTKAPIFCHEKERELITNKKNNLSALMGMDHVEMESDFYLKDKEKINFSNKEIVCIHTPGHTPGSVCYEIEENLFTGDTLFAGSIGRTDLFGGNLPDMKNSLKKLASIKKDLIILPGHSFASKLSREKKTNPYLIEAQK